MQLHVRCSVAYMLWCIGRADCFSYGMIYNEHKYACALLEMSFLAIFVLLDMFLWFFILL